jgi:hypothetical protein
MDRRKFTFAALLGLFGLKATAQEPTSGNVIRTDKWDGPFQDGEGGCYMSNHTLINLKRVVCNEGEEYCPLGHSQKAELGPTFGTKTVMVGDIPIGESFATTHTCSMCGIVYVPRKKDGR